MHDPTQTPCVVVADESTSSRAQSVRWLAERGFEVLEANDLEEVLTLSAQRPVDLVVCDLQMSGLRGGGLEAFLRQTGTELPVLLVTAFPTYETAITALRFGAADYLERPFRNADAFLDAVFRALEKRADQIARRGGPDRDPRDQDRVDELKRRFVSGVAHELRTPITVIRSLVSVLAKGVHGPLTREQQEILDHVLAESDTFAHEIDKLLSLARLENSDFQPDLRPVALEEILAPLERPLRFRAVERHVDLRFDVPDRHLSVLADAADVTRALHALAENALKFTAEDGHVVVRAVPADEGVFFEVQDDGIGIDPADHGRIFDPFVQVESPLTRHHGGCGIGLTYAARILAAHGTRIAIRSRLGKGASFSFLLPYAPEPLTESCTLEFEQGARHG
jgi:signal transduction histidine kinase